MQNGKPRIDWIESIPIRREKRPIGWLMTTIVGGVCAVVVAAILFPVFAVARSHSGPSCLSTIKLEGSTLKMYQEDYDGRFPRASEWMDATYPYLKNKRAYRCPTLDLSHPDDFGHAFNSSLELKALDKHKAPEKIVMLYDSIDLRWNANALGRAGMANPPRHPGGNVVGFADGHAKYQSLTDHE